MEMNNNKDRHLQRVPDIPTYATRDEVENAIRNLSTGDRKKLMVSAIFWWKKFGLQHSGMAPEDLLQEALYRSLKDEDARRWPKHVSFNKFISRSIESIASHCLEKIVSEDTKSDSQEIENILVSEEDGQLSTLGVNPRFDEQIQAQQELDDLKEFFGEDVRAFNALVMRACGMDAIEIQEELKADKTEWETIRKRIQRKLATYLLQKKEEL